MTKAHHKRKNGKGGKAENQPDPFAIAFVKALARDAARSHIGNISNGNGSPQRHTGEKP